MAHPDFASQFCAGVPDQGIGAAVEGLDRELVLYDTDDINSWFGLGQMRRSGLVKDS